MKKILALVLAVVLSFGALSVFAATTYKDATLPAIVKNPVSVTNPGGIMGIALTLDSNAIPADVQAAGVTNFKDWTVSSVKGSNIAGVFFNGKNTGKTDQVKGLANSDKIFIMAANYTGTSTKARTIEATVILRDPKGNRYEIGTYGVYNPDGTLTAIDLKKDVVDGEDIGSALTNQVFVAEEKATVTGQFGTVADFELKVPKKAKFNVAYSTLIPAALEEEYWMTDLTFVNVTGNTSALSAWTVSFLDADADAVPYAYVDGKLVNLPKDSWTYDKNDEVIKVKGTGSMGALVLSATDLKITDTAASAPTTSTANPATGSSDMIGVAVVMAVVSLGAAGAVAFKKASK